MDPKPTLQQHLDAMDPKLRHLAEAYIEGTGVRYEWLPSRRRGLRLIVTFDKS